MISILFLDETACEILLFVSLSVDLGEVGGWVDGVDGKGLLSGEGLVVHKEKVDVASVVDKECLVARGHHVAGFLV